MKFQHEDALTRDTDPLFGAWGGRGMWVEEVTSFGNPKPIRVDVVPGGWLDTSTPIHDALVADVSDER